MKSKRHIEPSGLRIITIPMKDNPTVTVLVLVETGSKYETKEQNGLSHFLEHMCFKGTAKRPSALLISHELDALGSQYNAFTAEEYTGYYAKGTARQFPKLLEIVSDIYLNSTFPDKEIEKEKGVIIEEINMYEDMPARDVQNVFTRLLYGDQPAGWNIIGPRENIRRMTRHDFLTYRHAHYVAQATTVVVAGNVSSRDAEKEVKKIFKQTPEGKKSRKKKVIEHQDKPEVALKFKKTDQAHLVLGVRSFPVAHQKTAALSVLASLLGGGMSSRLFQKLREEMGVAYYVRAQNDSYTDHGNFAVSAGVDVKRVPEVITEILSECDNLKSVPVTEPELKKVKDYLIGTLKLGLEGSDEIAAFYGGHEVLRLPFETPSDVARKINHVTSRELQALAQEIFDSKSLNLAIVGPFTDPKPFRKILKF